MVTQCNATELVPNNGIPKSETVPYLLHPGINRAVPPWERSRTEEDILRAALRPGSKLVTSGPPSASEDSNALEWENDFVVSRHPEDGEDSADFEGFVNPVLDTPTENTLDCSLRLDSQDR